MAVVLASLGAYAVYRRLDGNVSVVKVSGLSHRSVYGAQNILILGSQTRDGQRAGDLGTNPSLNTSNSDNLLLVHLNPTHTQAIVLSIPRDTMVYEPGCQARRTIGTGIMGPYQSAIIDGAMNIGGPSCAVSTVKDLTGIRSTISSSSTSTPSARWWTRSAGWRSASRAADTTILTAA